MAHHKRGRRKNARAGCLLCHGYKANGVKGTRNAQPVQELRARISEAEQSPDDIAHDARLDWGDAEFARYEPSPNPWCPIGWDTYEGADPVEVPEPLATIADIRSSFMRPTT